MKKHNFEITQKDIVANGLIAAAYAVLTIITSPISFQAIQFRISEIMVLLCFFNRRYSIGLVLGCVLANLVSPLGLMDIGFGTLATLLACLGMMFVDKLLLAIIFPVITNAFIVGFELFLIGEPFWFSCLTVGLGELAVLIVGYIIFILMKKNKKFFLAIGANRNIDFKF